MQVLTGRPRALNLAPGLWELCQPQSITASRRRLRFPSRSRQQLPAFMAGTSHTEARGKSRGPRGPGGWLRLLSVCPSVADTDCEHPGEARRPLHLASYGANETPSPLTDGWGGTPCPGLKAKLCLWARSDWLGHCVRTGSAERAGGPKASVCLVPCRRRPCSLLRDGDGLC